MVQADQLWIAAALFKAGTPSWVLVSGDNQPGGGWDAAGSGSDAVDVDYPGRAPATTNRVEVLSRNTTETSALRMLHAPGIFQAALRSTGAALLPAPTDV